MRYVPIRGLAGTILHRVRLLGKVSFLDRPEELVTAVHRDALCRLSLDQASLDGLSVSPHPHRLEVPGQESATHHGMARTKKENTNVTKVKLLNMATRRGQSG